MPFIRQVGSVPVRVREVAEPVSASGDGFSIPVELVHVFGVVGRERPVPSELLAFDVVEQNVVVVGQTLEGEPLGVCPTPDNLAAELGRFENRIK